MSNQELYKEAAAALKTLRSEVEQRDSAVTLAFEMLKVGAASVDTLEQTINSLKTKSLEEHLIIKKGLEFSKTARLTQGFRLGLEGDSDPSGLSPEEAFKVAIMSE